MHFKEFMHAWSCILCVHVFDKIVILFIHIALSIPMLISVKINHVNFKFLRSCQFQNLTVLSILNLSSSFKFKLLQLCQSNSVNCYIYKSFLLTAKWPVRVQEQLAPINLSLLTAKWPVRVQEQLALVNLSLVSVKWPVQIQEQHTFVIGQVASSYTRTACTYVFVSVVSQVTSSNTRTACAPCFSFSQVTSSKKKQEQLVPFLLINIPGQVPSSSQKNNLHLSSLLLSLPSESCY